MKTAVNLINNCDKHMRASSLNKLKINGNKIKAIFLRKCNLYVPSGCYS